MSSLTPESKTVVYSCPFVPAEWIAAHGLRPRRLQPRATAGTPGAAGFDGMCPYARAFEQAVRRASDVAGVVVTTTCDQMRRIHEPMAERPGGRAHLMHVPTACDSAVAHGLYRDELLRLGGFLEALGGVSPSAEHLADVMLDYDERRSALRAARGRLAPRRYSEAIARFHRDGTFEAPVTAHRTGGIRLGIVGGPLLEDDLVLFDWIEQAGGCVALDATTTGERALPAPLNRRSLRGDPLGELAEMYFGAIPDAFRRPNALLYQWLKREIVRRDLRGLIFTYYVWCDTWHAEAQRMKEWAGIPLLALEADDSVYLEARTSARIQAFMEMLS